MKHYLDALRKYNVVRGRATRKDYWMFLLFNMLISFVIGAVEGLLRMDSGIISTLYSLAIIFPNICLCTRRLHDVDKSGWWQLAVIVPFLNLYFFYLLWFKAGTPGSNKYGAPVGAAAPAAAEPVYGAYTVPAPNEFSGYEMCPAPKPMQAKKCAYCGEELEDGENAKFCSNCGAPVNK